MEIMEIMMAIMDVMEVMKGMTSSVHDGKILVSTGQVDISRFATTSPPERSKIIPISFW